MNTETVTQQSNLDAALKYAREGLPVLPLRGKQPLTQLGNEWPLRSLRVNCETALAAPRTAGPHQTGPADPPAE